MARPCRAGTARHTLSTSDPSGGGGRCPPYSMAAPPSPPGEGEPMKHRLRTRLLLGLTLIALAAIPAALAFLSAGCAMSAGTAYSAKMAMAPAAVRGMPAADAE